MLRLPNIKLGKYMAKKRDAIKDLLRSFESAVALGTATLLLFDKRPMQSGVAINAMNSVYPTVRVSQLQ